MKTLFPAAIALLTCASGVVAKAQTARPAITGISHYCVYTTDATKTEFFYAHDLGAAKRPDPEDPKGVRYYFSPTQFVEVLPLPATETTINRLDHVAFLTKDVEALRKYMGAHGIAVPAKGQTSSDGSLWFEVKDPEGNRVQFVQAPAKTADIPMDTLSSHIIHFGYMVRDEDAENAFYRTVLGFRPYWRGSGRDNTPPSWISQQVPDGTDWIEYMMVRDPQTKGIPASVTKQSLGTMDHIALGVPSMKKAFEVLYVEDRLTNRNAGGIKVARDGKWQFNMFDPDDTRVELMEFQPAVKPCCSEFTAAHPTK